MTKQETRLVPSHAYALVGSLVVVLLIGLVVSVRSNPCAKLKRDYRAAERAGEDWWMRSLLDTAQREGCTWSEGLEE